MPDNETVLYRGASFELGRGQGYYGIWPAGAPRPPSIEWWPETRDGWSGAWTRFTMLEPSGAIAQVSPGYGQPGYGQPGYGQAAQPGQAGQHGPAAPYGQAVSPPANARTRGLIAAALVGAGVAAGLVGLFPAYYGGQSLAHEPPNLVTHLAYLAAWLVSAVLILLGGTRLRAGALLGLGTSIITFGLFFADAGTAISSGAHLVGTGLILGLAGWALCAGGALTAFLIGPPLAQGRPRWDRTAPLLTAALTLAGLGVTIAFAPPWDSFTLQTATGASQTLTQGNAFANPAAVIAGNVAAMIAIVAVTLTAALWRPVRLGAALLAGALIPLVAQAISALVQISETPSPLQFGITPDQATRLGLTIDAGLTAAFWVYFALVLVMLAACGWMALSGRRPARQPVPEPPASQHIPA